mgnify:CR=1 FL=1
MRIVVTAQRQVLKPRLVMKLFGLLIRFHVQVGVDSGSGRSKVQMLRQSQLPWSQTKAALLHLERAALLRPLG